jgi:predicted HTH transcriptional regulator
MHQALHNQSSASLLNAIRQGEGATIEFKSSFQKEVIETLTAFANTQGSTEMSNAHIKLINSSWDYHPDPEHTMASISEPKVQAFADANPRREERWDYSMEALREIIINMIVHRDYRSANDSTIKVFDDRIEFFNPGVLLDALTVEKIKTGHYKSHLRNKQVATIFKELELIEKYGSGVRRVIDTFVAYGLPEPEFEATQGGLAVTVLSALTGGVTGGVNTESVPLLQLIQAQPGLKTTELVAQTGKPQRTIERWLKQLKDRQQIEFRGAPKTGGYYSKKTLNKPLDSVQQA